MPSSVSASPTNAVNIPKNINSRDDGDASSLVRAIAGSLDSVRRQSPGVQVAVGAGGGVFAGYIFGKTSKAFAICVGTGIILLQVAESQGYLRIQKKKLKEDFESARDRLGEMFDGAIDNENAAGIVRMSPQNSGKELLKVVAKNARFLCGFVGGILLGFGVA